MTNLGLTGTSFRNLDANVERSTRRGKRPRRTADAEIAEGVWPNQEPLLLSARLFFFFWQNGPISFFFGPVLTIVFRVREQAVIAFFLFIFKDICRIQICFSKMFAFLHFCYRIKVFCTIFLTLNSEILFNVICTTGDPPQQFRKIFDCLI